MPPGLGKAHGPRPSIVEAGEMPCSRAVARTKGLNDEPGCWPTPWVAMLYLSVSKPRPPTNARTAPVPGSTLTTEAVNSPSGSGMVAATASSASVWSRGSSVVLIVSPPRNRVL